MLCRGQQLLRVAREKRRSDGGGDRRRRYRSVGAPAARSRTRVWVGETTHHHWNRVRAAYVGTRGSSGDTRDSKLGRPGNNPRTQLRRRDVEASRY